MLVVDAILRKLAFLPGWEKKYSFNKGALQFGPNTYLEGFWQSDKYFSEIESTVRDDFTLKNPLPENIKSLAREIKNSNSLCIHLRRMHGGGSYHAKYDMDYYQNGIKYIEKYKKIEKIYVFSDDIEWCKENIKFNIPTFFVGNDSAGVKGEGHLYLMSLCQNFVIPNSPFSWWGAWLCDYKEKIVICPKQWFGDASINTSDLIPEDWIRI